MPDELPYFDTHLHLPTPDRHGVDALLRHIERQPGWRGGNLILNSDEELDAAMAQLTRLPEELAVTPCLTLDEPVPWAVFRGGWVKLHPVLQRITREQLPRWVERVHELADQLRGVIVHAFPWGVNLSYEVSLELVLAVAAACPRLWVLVAHGGGYESWRFRAHAGSLPNVVFDYSATLKYYAGSDLLQPLGHLARHKPEKLLFGSDWPTADPQPQLREAVRVAATHGVEAPDLAALMLANSQRLFGPIRATADSNAGLRQVEAAFSTATQTREA